MWKVVLLSSCLLTGCTKTENHKCFDVFGCPVKAIEFDFGGGHDIIRGYTITLVS